MDALTGEIRPFAFGFAPKNWALCNGQILSIKDYIQLYAVLGTLYGGNGTSTFALPDIQGTVLIGSGDLSGSTTVYNAGDKGGVMGINLLLTQIPAHEHLFNGMVTNDENSAPTKEVSVPTDKSYLSNVYEVPPYTTKRKANSYTPAAPDSFLHQDSVSKTGNNEAHNNMQPYLVINYCICTNGNMPEQP